MITENLSTLKIHNLSQAHFDTNKEDGTLAPNEFYLTPAPEIDSEPIENSQNLITSGAVFDALLNVTPDLAIDTKPIEGSGNLITSGAVYDALQNDGLNSDNIVSSVNGKTGTVVLTADDIGALPDTTVIPTVPTNISSFSNDKGYLTQQSLDNYALKADLNNKQNVLTFDSAPTADSNNPVTSQGIYAAIGEVIATATGKCKVVVFDTVAELDSWLASSNNTKDLNTGDIFLVRAVNVPDYWWDKTTQTKQILETTKVDLNSYALKSEIPTIPSSLPANGGNADTIDNYHIRVTTTDDGGQSGYITFVIEE